MIWTDAAVLGYDGEGRRGGVDCLHSAIVDPFARHVALGRARV